MKFWQNNELKNKLNYECSNKHINLSWWKQVLIMWVNVRKDRSNQTSKMMKNSSPGSPCTTIFCPSSNWTGSKASATVRRSHLSRDSEDGEQETFQLNWQKTLEKVELVLVPSSLRYFYTHFHVILISTPNASSMLLWAYF